MVWDRAVSLKLESSKLLRFISKKKFKCTCARFLFINSISFSFPYPLRPLIPVLSAKIPKMAIAASLLGHNPVDSSIWLQMYFSAFKRAEIG